MIPMAARFSTNGTSLTAFRMGITIGDVGGSNELIRASAVSGFSNEMSAMK